MTVATERRKNQRRGPDILVKLIHWFGICVWALLLIVIVILDQARPRLATFFDRIFHIDLRTTWDYDLVRTALFLMIVTFCLSAIGLVINSKRHRRKEDRYNRSLIIMGILAAIGIVLCFLYGNLF